MMKNSGHSEKMRPGRAKKNQCDNGIVLKFNISYCYIGSTGAIPLTDAFEQALMHQLKGHN